jgi:hypothetical protein
MKQEDAKVIKYMVGGMVSLLGFALVICAIAASIGLAVRVFDVVSG